MARVKVSKVKLVEVTHTPEPWLVHFEDGIYEIRGDAYEGGSKFKRVASVEDKGRGRQNAHLIASAPAMLALHRKLAAWLERLAKDSDAQEANNRGRFDSLADACAFDAKNSRAVAKEINTLIAKAVQP